MVGSQTVTITVTGLEDVQRKLKNLSQATSDLSPVMGDVGQYLSRFFSSEVFASRGGVIGEPWAPLSARYAALKAKQYPGRPPLVRTGVMQRSFKYDKGAHFARIYNNSPVFDYHQSNSPRSKMPERVMMKVDDAREREIGRLIEKFINDKIGGD